VHLDLTTDKTKFKALIHSSPTIADLDGDGRSEIIIGTSLGLLYVLDGTVPLSLPLLTSLSLSLITHYSLPLRCHRGHWLLSQILPDAVP
jgi:hypothetical protein